LNRIDEIVMFSPLTLEDMDRIVDLQMKEVRARLEEQGLTVGLTEAARKWLAKEGFDINFGARPLRRVLQKNVESQLSVALLSGQFTSGDKVIVDLDTEKGQLVFIREEGKKEVTKEVKKTAKVEQS